MAIALAQHGWRFRRPSVIPGFGLTFGFSIVYLSLIVLIPLAGVVWRSASLGWPEFWRIASDPRTLGALKMSFGGALAAAAINIVFGTLVAWVLVRYRFPGKRVVDAMVDLPFALPTAVAGIALTTLYAPNGWIGGLVAPLLIVIRLEEYNYAAATAIATMMLAISFAMLFAINLIQAWSRRRYGYGS